jgi:chromosome partitioning protein
MLSICIAGGKGGTGKSTVSVNLAAALAEQGQRVLLLDLDPQGAASNWIGAPPFKTGLSDVLTGGAPLVDQVVPTRVSRVELVPADPRLAATARTLAGEVGAETVLRGAINQLPAGRWSWLICDTPPGLGLLAVSALVACKRALIPFEPTPLTLGATGQIKQIVDQVRDRLNPDLELAGFVAVRGNPRARMHRETVEQLRSAFGRLVLDTAIRTNCRVAESPAHGLPITSYDPDCNGAADFRALARELQERTSEHDTKSVRLAR